MLEKVQQEIVRAGETWQAYAAGFADGYIQHLEAIRLMDRVSLTAEETVFAMLESIDANLASSLQLARERCQQSRNSLIAAFDASQPAESLIQELTRAREQDCEFIRSVTLGKLNRLRESRELNALIEVMLERFSALASELPESQQILDESSLEPIADFGQTPPTPALKTVPLREIARSFLETRIARDLAEVNRMMFEHVDNSIQVATEVCQIISFNLRVAAQECERVAPSASPAAFAHAKKLALDGMDLAISRLDSTIEKLGRLKAQIYDQIIAHVDVRTREVEALAFQRAGLEEQSRLKQKLLLARSARYLDQTRNWLSRNYQNLVTRYRPLSRVVVEDLKTTLGLHQFTPAEVLAIYDQAKLDPAALGHLPFIYRKLFDISPLESAELLVARDQEMRLIETARDRWLQGMPCAVAVIGELGSGKTSLINAAIAETLRGFPVDKQHFIQTQADEGLLAAKLAALFGLPPVRTFDELQTRLAELAERRVVVLEDAHQLYLRALGGFETLKKLLLLVARTSRQILWIVSMRQYAWQYLNSVLRISDSFSFVVGTENLAHRELEQVILARHQVSGFQLRFLPDEVIQQRRKYRQASEAEQQAMLRAAFFDALGKASEGNILAAIFYWLKSLSEMRGNELIVRPLERLRFDFLHDAPIEQLLTLSLLIQHGNLTANEHARIFGTDAGSSLAMLSYLTNINLLTREGTESSTERFAVNRVIYIPLTRELRAKNILPQTQ